MKERFSVTPAAKEITSEWITDAFNGWRRSTRSELKETWSCQRERRVGRARRPRRRKSASSGAEGAGGVLTAAVSVGTDHRPFWCLLTDAAFGLIAVHIVTRGELSTADSDLLRQPIRSLRRWLPRGRDTSSPWPRQGPREGGGVQTRL